MGHKGFELLNVILQVWGSEMCIVEAKPSDPDGIVPDILATRSEVIPATISQISS